MRYQWLLLGAVLVSCLVASHAQYLEVLGGLALLKGVAIAGYKFGRHSGGGYNRRPYYGSYHYRRHRRYRRAVLDDASQEEDVLLSSVTELDPNGCLLKLLCLTQATPEETRTSYQAVLMHLFGDISHATNPASMPFAQALQAGGSRRKTEATCHSKYLQCPLSGSVLQGMLVMAWNTNDQQPYTPSI